jgi:6-phosphogluconolactonase (cycloisomerase 2 family)
MLWSGFLVLAALAGCSAVPSGTDNAVTATVSSSSVAVVVGGNRTVSIAFNADDGHAVTNFTVTGGLTNLPSAWSGPGSFDCASVATGSGCVLNLKYTPVAAGTGTITISYGYMNNAGVAEAGSVAIAYTATTSNNVVGAAFPAGQINATVGGSQSVGVNFTTDDGNPASTLLLTTDLATLPAGWSAASTGFSCSSVSTGNGCRLALTYSPTSVGGGTLTLNYSYKDNSGTAKTGSVDFAYASTVHDNVAAAVSPSGEVTAVAGGNQSVGITFTTDDGNPASALTLTTDLSTLPAYWSTTASSFSCSSVSTGNGCHLTLSFAPTAVGSGTLALNYGYKDNSGTAKTGTVNIPYASTSHNNASVAVSPSGQVAVVAGGSPQPVTVTFTSDDGNAVTALSITSGLTGLPAGWSVASPSFSCASAATGNACRLTLTYAPTAVAVGSLTLNYAYADNSGTAKTGSVNIPYAGTEHDNVNAAVSPSGTISVSVVGTQAVNVTFTTDDGNAATALSITTDLTTLPAGWTSASNSFSCSAVSTGSACRLALTFAPTSVSSGNLGLNFSYDDNAGTAKTGSVSIAYAGTPQQHLYAVNYGADTVSVCPIKGDGSLDTCQITGSGFNTPEDIKILGNLAYVVNYLSQSVVVCTIQSGATLSNCVATGSGFQYPMGIAINGAGTLAYVSTFTPNPPSVCAIDVNGLLTNCVSAGVGVDNSWDIALSEDGNYAYLSSPGLADIDTCTIASNGTFSACTGNSASLEPFGIAVNGAYLYQANLGPGSVGVCPLNSDGTIGTCAVAGNFASPVSITFNGNLAYVSNYGANNIAVCPVNSDGTFGTCTVSADASFNTVWGIAIH